MTVILDGCKSLYSVLLWCRNFLASVILFGSIFAILFGRMQIHIILSAISHEEDTEYLLQPV